MHIEVIYGGAGTGKTYQLLHNLPSSSFIILAPTHTAVRNLVDRADISPDHFATIYSYFRIDYENDDLIGAVRNYKYIYIDEFGLIKKELFRKILNWLDRNNRDVTLTIAGDVVQLSPIYLEERFISFNKLKKHYQHTYAHIIEHDYNSIFSLSKVRNAKKTILTKNFRSNADVLGLIWNIFYDVSIDRIKYISITKVVTLLEAGATFISSRYSHHEAIYDLLKKQISMKQPTQLIHNLLFYEGAKFLVAENTKNSNNGDILTFSYATNDVVYFKEGHCWSNDYKLLPIQLLTAHKSQGLGIDTVIVCVDDLFDSCMFYTMCTRAINNLYFFRYKEVDLLPYLQQFHQLLEYYGYILTDTK